MITDGRLGKLDPLDSRDSRNGAQPSSWATVPDAFRRAGGPLPPPWEELFGPLRKGGADGLVVVGQCGQSIDARIATPTGHSHYINGEAGLIHLHRLRALVDAVVVGVGTAIKDDPRLTVRRVEGPSPARVIIDPSGRIPPSARVLRDDGIRRLVITWWRSSSGAVSWHARFTASVSTRPTCTSSEQSAQCARCSEMSAYSCRSSS